MSSIAKSPQLIEKEEVSKLKFPSAEVLENPTDRVMRNRDIDQASTLGNTRRHKVKISFEDNENLKVVNTTIWAVTEKRIILKAGVMVPIHRIHSINFF